jgi:hypothetical protein
MSQNRDKILRDKINEAALEELMPQFDEESMWKEIRRRNTTARSGIKEWAYQYGRYAAVLVLGLLLGFYFNQHHQSQTLCAQKMIVKQFVRDTISVNSTLPPAPINTPQKRSIKPQVLALNNTDNEPIIQNVVLSQTPLPEVERVLLKEEQPMRVVYFEDLEKEHKSLAQLSEKKSRKKIFQIKTPQPNESVSQEMPLRNLIYALNK